MSAPNLPQLCWLAFACSAAPAHAAPAQPANPNAAATTPAQDPNISAEDAAILQDLDFFALFDLLRDMQLFVELP